jgi:hypothetical protein
MREMSLHTVAVLFILLGLTFFVYCVIEAELCYRKVTRYLKQNARRESIDGQDDREGA